MSPLSVLTPLNKKTFFFTLQDGNWPLKISCSLLCVLLIQSWPQVQTQKDRVQAWFWCFGFYFNNKLKSLFGMYISDWWGWRLQGPDDTQCRTVPRDALKDLLSKGRPRLRNPGASGHHLTLYYLETGQPQLFGEGWFFSVKPSYLHIAAQSQPMTRNERTLWDYLWSMSKQVNRTPRLLQKGGRKPEIFHF